MGLFGVFGTSDPLRLSQDGLSLLPWIRKESRMREPAFCYHRDG